MISKTIDQQADLNILKAFETLDQLWKKELVPWHLERHYFLYWFAFYRGDLDKTAQAHQVHRNTIQFHFMRFGLLDKTDEFCRAWDQMGKNKNASFEAKLLKFYELREIKCELSVRDSKVLIKLWRSGFTFPTISAHYMLWALRNQKDKEWIQKKLGYTSHHCMRVLVTVLDPQTPNGRWLAPLKPQPGEIYTRGPRNRFMQPKPFERKMAVSE